MSDIAINIDETDAGIWFETEPKTGPAMGGYLNPKGKRPITVTWVVPMTVEAFKTIVDDTEATYRKAGARFDAKASSYADKREHVEGITSLVSSHVRADSDLSRVDFKGDGGRVTLWANHQPVCYPEDDKVGICFEEALAPFVRDVVLKAFRDTTCHDGEALFDVILKGARESPVVE